MVVKGEYRTFEKAREFVQKLGLKSAREWRKYVNSGDKPDNIPANPNTVYKKHWKGFEDWLGYTAYRSKYIELLPFKEALDFIRRLNLQGDEEWKRYCKSGKKPKNIPARPDIVYKNEWKGIQHWVGTLQGSGYGKFQSFVDARKYVRQLKLRGMLAWHAYSKSDKKPRDIPSHPEVTYKREWKGWSDWTGFYPQREKFGNLRSYDESKKFIHTLGLKNVEDWNRWKKIGKKPLDIPSTPNLVYKDEWKGYGDWLGTSNSKSK